MRATRDLLRRRVPLPRKRAALLAPVQKTKSQDHLPEIGKQLASKAKRDGVAARCPAPAVPKRVAVDRARIAYDGQRRSDGALPIVQTATQPHAQTLSRLPSVPGIGKMWRVVLRYEMPAIPRVPRGQDFVSACRLVTCAKASAGKRSGTSGATLGKTDLTWAFSEVAVLVLRNTPAGQTYRACFEHKHGTGHA